MRLHKGNWPHYVNTSAYLVWLQEIRADFIICEIFLNISLMQIVSNRPRMPYCRLFFFRVSHSFIYIFLLFTQICKYSTKKCSTKTFLCKIIENLNFLKHAPTTSTYHKPSSIHKTQFKSTRRFNIFQKTFSVKLVLLPCKT